MKGRELYRKLVRDQQRWIEQCEANEKSSYYGENGLAVQRADQNELRRLEERAS